MKTKRFRNYIPLTAGVIWAAVVPFIYTTPILGVLGGIGGMMAGFFLTLFLEFQDMLS